MKITTFASGSSGNCALIEDGSIRFLIDAGISLRRIKTALSAHGLFWDDLRGVFITHEHSDHIAAIPMLVKYTSLPIFAPRSTANYLRRTVVGIEDRLCEISPFESFSLGEVRITPFPTPHDTPGSVGYRIDGGVSFGFCTDTGHVSEAMLRYLPGCAAAVIEANHDPELLRAGPYPLPLKRRILSENGHLSNGDCALFACRLAESGAKHIVLGHLSRENNRPDLAFHAVRGALDRAGFADVTVDVAPPCSELSLELSEC